MWASHAPTHEAKEEKYKELSRKGVLDEVEKLFMAKEIKAIGKKRSEKSDKKQIISGDLMRNFRKFFFGIFGMWECFTNSDFRYLSCQVLAVLC